jgi:hypothetical protein
MHGGLAPGSETDSGRGIVLQRVHEPLSDPHALRLPDEGRRNRVPSHFTSLIHAAAAMYWGSHSQRTRKPRAMSLANPPKAIR